MKSKSKDKKVIKGSEKSKVKLKLESKEKSKNQ